MRPYYEHGGVTLYCGDCREVLPSLAAGSVDLVLTDPPFPGYRNVYGNAYEMTASDIAGAIPTSTRSLIFWPALLPPPIPEPDAEHVWHKPNHGNGSHQYERILAYGGWPRRCRVYRAAAILPNYCQFAAECVDHPCQKPLNLVRHLLIDANAQWVLDLFAGSGTTLVAAKQLGRRAIGIEIEERYCEIAARRLSQEVLPLDVPTAPEPIRQLTLTECLK